MDLHWIATTNPYSESIALSKIPFTPLVEGLPASVPFVGPETLERERGTPFKARIGANESAFGISPKAVEAMAAAAAQSSWYGDPENFELREALAEHHGVTMDEICVDAGIDTILGLAVRMLMREGDPVVTSLGAYPTFNYHVSGYGGQLVTVPYKDDHEDPGALIDKTRELGAPIVYFANPDNPMGTWYNADVVQQFIDSVPDGSVAVLDEAYVDFAPEGVAPAIDTTNPRVMRMRTFSKAYGMAGARIGYVIAHKDLITGLNKIRNHFGVNRIAQAGALASIKDEAFLAEVKQKVEAGRVRIAEMAESLGLVSLPSATNFVAVDVGSSDRAKILLTKLHEDGIFIRMPGVPPLDRCIRVGIGTPEEHEIFAEAFARRLAEV